MKRMIAFLACALYCMPIFSQVIYNRLMEQIAVWDTTRIEEVLAEKFNDLINANKEKWISQVNYAKENYDVTVVFQAIVSYDDAGINISIERNDFPLDLYYIISNKRDVKLRVLTYKGEIAFVDDNFSGLMIGIAKKEEKAFRYIIKQRPDLIFMCNDVFGCYFYVKNDIVYIYDYYKKEKGPLKDYSRLSELFEANNECY